MRFKRITEYYLLKSLELYQENKVIILIKFNWFVDEVHNKFWPLKKYFKKSLNKQFRKKQILRIAKENSELFQRIAG
jgi:hypothetical protein